MTIDVHPIRDIDVFSSFPRRKDICIRLVCAEYLGHIIVPTPNISSNEVEYSF